MSTMRKRKYKKEFLYFGFTVDVVENVGAQVVNAGTQAEDSEEEIEVIERPVCIFCGERLSQESMKPNRLNLHFTKKHPKYAKKPKTFFEDKLKAFEKQQACLKSFVVMDNSARLASYKLAYRIAKSKKPYSIGESLVLPAAKEIVSVLFGDEMARKVSSIPASNDTIERRVNDIADFTEETLVKKLQVGRFSIQLDESTDCSNESLLLCCVRYFDANDITEEMLFCKEIPDGTTGLELFQILNGYFVSQRILWKNCVGLCTDGAASMCGKFNGLKAHVLKMNAECL